MTKDCSLIFQFSTWKLQAENMLCTQIVLFWHSEQFMYTTCSIFWTCSELAISMSWTRNLMNNQLSYFGLVDAKIWAFDKDFPVNRGCNFEIPYILTVLLSILLNKLPSLPQSVWWNQMSSLWKWRISMCYLKNVHRTAFNLWWEEWLSWWLWWTTKLWR